MTLLLVGSHLVTTGHIWSHIAFLVTPSAGHNWSYLVTTGTIWSHLILSGHMLYCMFNYCDYYSFSSKFTSCHIWQHKAKLVTPSADHIWSQLATTGTTWSHMILSGHRLHYMLTYCDFYPFSNKVQLGNTWSLLVTYRIADITLSWSHLVLSGHILYSIVTSDNIWSILITYYSM